MMLKVIKDHYYFETLLFDLKISIVDNKWSNENLLLVINDFTVG